MDVSWRYLQYKSAYSHYVAPDIYHMKTGRMDTIYKGISHMIAVLFWLILLEFITKVISIINQHWFR